MVCRQTRGWVAGWVGMLAVALAGLASVGAAKAQTAVGEPPVNDDCPNPIEVGPLPAVLAGDSTAATTDVPFPCGFFVDGPFRNVWYSVIGTGGTLTATTCSPNTEITDTEIAVYCADCEFSVCVDGNDDDCGGPNTLLSTISWCSQPGQVYFITVGGGESSTPTGVFELSVSDEGDSCEFPVECDVITGACCAQGDCEQTTTEDLCDGEFFPGETCPDFECPSGCQCDDGLFCNGMEFCDEFDLCQAGTPVDCSHLNDDCNIGVCDEDSDSCVATPLPDGTTCDDGMFCTDLDSCIGGECVGAPHCDDQNPCTIDTCDEMTDACVFTPDDDFCDNGDFCDGVETCDPMLGCVPGTDVDCSHLNGVCLIGVCDELQDMCVAEVVEDGQSCDDGMFCTEGEVCGSGMCQGGTPIDCSDSVDCTVDSCNEDTDTCVYAPDDGACDDSSVCTDDSCDPMSGCVNSANDLCGACCDAAPGLSGACVEDVTAEECAGEHQMFYPGGSCDTINCVEVTGACCDGATSDCTVTTQGNCNCALCVWSADVDCDQIICQPPVTPIPTTSEWGLVVMALLLATGMKLGFGRAESPA